MLDHRLFLAEWLVYRLASWHGFLRIRNVRCRENEVANKGDLENQVLQEEVGVSSRCVK